MPNFIAIGTTWYNMDKIKMVTVHEPEIGSFSCTIHFCGNETHELKGEDARKLNEALDKSAKKQRGAR